MTNIASDISSSGSGRKGMTLRSRVPLGPISLIFMQFSTKRLPSNRFSHHPVELAPLWAILDPPLTRVYSLIPKTHSYWITSIIFFFSLTENGKYSFLFQFHRQLWRQFQVALVLTSLPALRAQLFSCVLKVQKSLIMFHIQLHKFYIIMIDSQT